MTDCNISAKTMTKTIELIKEDPIINGLQGTCKISKTDYLRDGFQKGFFFPTNATIVEGTDFLLHGGRIGDQVERRRPVTFDEEEEDQDDAAEESLQVPPYMRGGLHTWTIWDDEEEANSQEEEEEEEEEAEEEEDENDGRRMKLRR